MRCVIIDLNTDEEQERVLEIVGYEESDPSRSQVSYHAPLGKALMGLRVNGFHETCLPQDTVGIEVLELYPHREEALGAQWFEIKDLILSAQPPR
jgi:transcription elongation GreA/GreB family factor